MGNLYAKLAQFCNSPANRLNYQNGKEVEKNADKSNYTSMAYGNFVYRDAYIKKKRHQALYKANYDSYIVVYNKFKNNDTRWKGR